MGLNNRNAIRFLIDLETAPIADAAEYLDLSDISAPANYKDEAKIKAYCEAKQAEMVSKAALDLDLCRIVAMGWMSEDGDGPHVLSCQNEAMEAEVLKGFWAVLDDRMTIGYNQVGFDLPILMRRSLYLGVTHPILNLDKYRTTHIDLQQRLSLNGTKPYRSLNWYCKRLKLDVPDDDNKGSDIGALVQAEHWDAITAHCRVDVLKTRALAERLGVVQPVAVGVF